MDTQVRASGTARDRENITDTSHVGTGWHARASTGFVLAWTAFFAVR